jgi:hypothetical protein
MNFLPAPRFWIRPRTIIPFATVLLSSGMSIYQLPNWQVLFGLLALVLSIIGWWVAAFDEERAVEREGRAVENARSAEKKLDALVDQVSLEARERVAQPDRVQILQRETRPAIRSEVERLAHRMIDLERRLLAYDRFPATAGLPESAKAQLMDNHRRLASEKREAVIGEFRRDLLSDMLALERELLRRLNRPPVEERGPRTIAFEGDLVGPNPLTEAATYLRLLANSLG